MKRALAIFAAVSLFGFAGMAQMFSGSWETCLDILPTLGLDSTTLTITYDMAGWAITSVTGFTGGATGLSFTQQDFSVSGTLGALSITGGMNFDPPGPAYESSWVEAVLDFAGVNFDLLISHTIQTPNYIYCPQTGSNTADAEMVYSLGITADPVSAGLTFVDCCTGIFFHDLYVSFSGLSLCCGVTYDFYFSFNKVDGFDKVVFSLNDVFPICCGISFDISVTFTVDGKTVSVTPKFAGFGEACFELYADLKTEGGENIDLYLNAIRIDGWRLYCELADCNWLEIVTFLSETNAPLYGYYDFEEGEFEYIKLHFCGPTCCGGTYEVGLAVYFTSDDALFGISRIGAELTWPVADNFEISVTFDSNGNLGMCWLFSF